MNAKLQHPRMTLMVASLFIALPLAAVNGTWNGATGGNWSDTTKWSGGTVADGADFTATFSTGGNVTVDTARTIGNITHSAGGQLLPQAPASGPLTLQTSSGTPVIENQTTANDIIKVPLAGTQGFVKKGNQRIALWNEAVNPLSGDIRVERGELRFDSAGATLPAVGQVVVTNANSAARLHLTVSGDPMSVYPCAFRLSGYLGLTTANPATMNSFGPLFINGAALEAAVSNIVLTTDVSATTRIGQGGVGGKIEFRGTISGAGAPEFFLGSSSVKTIDFFGSNTYTAATTIRLSDANARATSNLRGPQRLPKTDLLMYVPTGAVSVIDLRSNNQTVKITECNSGGTTIIRSTGGAGVLTMDNGGSYGLVMNNGGKWVVESGGASTPGYVANRDNCEIVVSGATFTCGLEILQGAGQGSGIVTVADNGLINNFVYRASSDGPGVCNLQPGGTLQVSAIHTDVSTQTGTINFNGGTLSDGTWNEWGTSYTDWIKGSGVNVMVNAGGARIEVNNINGRVINKVLQNGGGGGGLVKLGAGTLTLTANNTYTGATIVSNGTLRVHGSISASSGVTVDGGAIGGTGTLAATTVRAGAIIAPGASVGTLTVAALTMEANSICEWEKGAGVNNADKIVVSGNLTINSPTTIKVVPLTGATPDGAGVTNTICQVGGTLTGFSNLQLDLSATPGWSGALVQDGQNVGVILMPEPMAGLLLGLLALAGLRRR
ncbi:MAG: autotransporter-associated beta strand repeat-containing protein [bacterium]|nr:autotransporter-associated beta strand repeat-containing protein [bacterium]